MSYFDIEPWPMVGEFAVTMANQWRDTCWDICRRFENGDKTISEDRYWFAYALLQEAYQ